MPTKFLLEQGHPLVQASVARKKKTGLGILRSVSREPRPRSNCGGLGGIFCVESRGVGRGNFVTLIRVSLQCKVKEFFLCASPAKSML